MKSSLFQTKFPLSCSRFHMRCQRWSACRYRSQVLPRSVSRLSSEFGRQSILWRSRSCIQDGFQHFLQNTSSRSRWGLKFKFSFYFTIWKTFSARGYRQRRETILVIRFEFNCQFDNGAGIEPRDLKNRKHFFEKNLLFFYPYTLRKYTVCPGQPPIEQIQ